MNTRTLLSVVALSLVGVGGCAVVPGPYGPQVVPAPVVVTPAYRHPGYAYPGYGRPPAVVYPGYGRRWHGRGHYR